MFWVVEEMVDWVVCGWVGVFEEEIIIELVKFVKRFVDVRGCLKLKSN